MTSNTLSQRRRRARLYASRTEPLRRKFYGNQHVPVVPEPVPIQVRDQTRIELAWEQERAGMVLRRPPSFTSWRDRNQDEEDEARLRRELRGK